MSIHHSHFPDAKCSEGLHSSPVDQTQEMEEEVVTISSTSHGIGREGEKSLLEKMWTSRDCFDLTLVCADGQQVFAHRAILSSCRFDLKDVCNAKNETSDQ